jgi:alpha-glucosidase
VQRSLAINHPHDDRVYDGKYYNQYFFGPSILVAPVESNKELLKIFFPEGDWVDVYTGKIWTGNQETIVESPIHKLPVFIKAGSVLPMQAAAANTSIKQEELALHIYCGNNSSEFLLYQDDGDSFDYQSGKSVKRLIQMNGFKNTVTISASEGDFISSYKKIKIVLHGSSADKISFNGMTLKLTSQVHSFFAPLEKYDPINEPDSMGEENVRVAFAEYTSEKIELSWD